MGLMRCAKGKEKKKEPVNISLIFYKKLIYSEFKVMPYRGSLVWLFFFSQSVASAFRAKVMGVQGVAHVSRYCKVVQRV